MITPDPIPTTVDLPADLFAAPKAAVAREADPRITGAAVSGRPVEGVAGSARIHPAAIVESGARIGVDVSIGAFAIVEAGVALGDGCRVGAHAVVRSGSRIGQRVTIDSFAVICGDPQDKGFDCSTPSGVVIGNDVTIREGATVHRATVSGANTIVEDDVYLMANSHVGHDSVVRRGTVLANNVMLAGHVEIGEFSTLGGGAGVHQFARVGQGAMIGGNASVSYDAPPYTICVDRNRLVGLNLVGLRRSGVDKATIRDLKACFRTVFGQQENIRDVADQTIRAAVLGQSIQGGHFLEFCRTGTRGFVKPLANRSR